MKRNFTKRCILKLKLEGETHVSVFPAKRVVFIDNISCDDIRKSFFSDFQGRIICPSQMNNILKHSPKLKRSSFFYSSDIVLVFFKCENPDYVKKDIYLNLSNKSKSCYLKVIFSDHTFCLGVIQDKPDRDLSECLKMLPKDALNWQKLIIKDESFYIITKEK